MTKKIQAYFDNEDKAFILKDKLLKFKVSHVEIGSTADHPGGVNTPVIPRIGIEAEFGVQGASGMVGGAGSMGMPGIIPEAMNAMGNEHPNFTNATVVLSAETDDDLYEQVSRLIKENGGWFN